MPYLGRDSAEKIGFALSVAVLVFLAGYLTREFRWFPHPLLQRAVGQGERVLASASRPPDFTSSRPAGSGRTEAEDAADLQPALTLVTTSWEDFDWNPGLKLIDRQGRVLHEWRLNPTEVFEDSDHRRGTDLSEQDIQGSLLLPDGDVVANVEYAGTVRLDACGRVQWRLAEGSHHSIARAEDGTFWIPGITERGPSTSDRYPDGFPGLDASIYQALILHVAEDGELLRTINVLDLLYDNDLERFIPKNRQQDRADVVHMNDVEPLPPDLADDFPLFEAGDLLVSLRNLDMVFVFDPDTRRVKWHATLPFIMQHDPDFLAGGWIGVFDNNWDGTDRGTMLGGSRIVTLQPHTDSTRVPFPTPESEPFYTAHRGKWQKLDNGNRLLTESGEGRIVEVAPDGRTVWEWSAGTYSEGRVPSVTRGHRVHVTRREVASWPCAPDSVR